MTGERLAGGSGGIGSVAHGGLRDFDTVRAFEVVTMEAEPRVSAIYTAWQRSAVHWWLPGYITVPPFSGVKASIAPMVLMLMAGRGRGNG